MLRNPFSSPGAVAAALASELASRDASISGLQASKADASALTAYALQSTVDTSSEVDSKIAAALLDAVTTAALLGKADASAPSQPTKSPRRWCSYYTIAQVDGLLTGKLGVTEAASALQIAVRFPDDGGADEVVAAIGEQILGPTDVSLSNGSPLQRGPGHAHRGSERGRLHPDPGGEPVEHRAHLQLDPGPRASLRLPLPTRHGLQLRGAHVRGRQRLRPPVRQLRGRPGRLEHGQDVLHSASKLHFGAHLQAPGLPNQTAGTVDVYGLQILDATLETGNAAEAEEDTAASALLLKHEFLDGGADDVTLATLGEVLLEPTLTTLGNFLVRSNSQSSVASASFTVGLRHDPERVRLEHRAHLRADAGETTPSAAGTGWARPPTW